MVKFHKKLSKRVTCRKKYKIIRKVAQHNKKLRRLMKKNPKSKKTKDPGVPNSVPFKDEIIREAELQKQRAKDLKEAQRLSRLKLQNQDKDLQDVAEEANLSIRTFEKVHNPTERTPKSGSENFKSYYKELKNVVESADVVLEVLDSRDPLGSRCPEVEQMVLNSGKKLVLVLNKIDLIPKANLEEWLKYLRRELPTVAFKASTQTQADNLSHSKVAAIHISESLQSSRRCVGASFLMKVLGNYCRNQNIQTFIKVGVVGFPNVGKSSIINSLKRSRSCSVGATPGVTKSVQEVSIDKHIKILDCPGVVFAKDGSATVLALRNAVKIENLNDVISPAEAIVERADHSQLCLHYNIPRFNSSHELFCLLSKKMGRFKKGGIPNYEDGARKLINDWNAGKIKYYSHPPEEYEASVHISAEIVSEMGKAFDISVQEEEMELNKVMGVFPSQGIIMKSSEPTNCSLSEPEESMEAENVSDRKMTVVFDSNKRKNVDSEDDSSFLRPEEHQNKFMKKTFKKMKRRRKKDEKIASALSDSIDSTLVLN